MATLKELKNDYTLDEAYQMWDIIVIDQYNQAKSNMNHVELAKRKKRNA